MGLTRRAFATLVKAGAPGTTLSFLRRQESRHPA
jgi:hypothetical protein